MRPLSATWPVSTLSGRERAPVDRRSRAASRRRSTARASCAASRTACGLRSRSPSERSSICFEPTVPALIRAPLISFAACAGPPSATNSASSATTSGTDGRRMRGRNRRIDSHDRRVGGRLGPHSADVRWRPSEHCASFWCVRERIRRRAAGVALALFLCCAPAAGAAVDDAPFGPSPAQRVGAFAVVPGGFDDTVAISNLTNPTSVRFAPDGRVFVAEKDGVVKVFDSINDTTCSTVFARPEVRGVLLRPRPWAAVAHRRPTVARPPLRLRPLHARRLSGAPPSRTTPARRRRARRGRLCDPRPPTAPPRPERQGERAGAGRGLVPAVPEPLDRLARVRRRRRAVRHGGDGASFNYADYGRRTARPGTLRRPAARAGGAIRPTAEGGALAPRTCATRRPGHARRHGHPGRPRHRRCAARQPARASADANARRIVALRPPQPVPVRRAPGTTRSGSATSAGTTWEEIDRIPTRRPRVENFGWPCYEGAARQGCATTAATSICENLYGAGASAPHAPYLHLQPRRAVVAGEVCPTGTSSISGLAFYPGGPYPGAYDGALFFADYARDCIWAMMPGADGLPTRSRPTVRDARPAGRPGDRPGGDLFYVDLVGGTVRRVRVPQPATGRRCRAIASPDRGPRRSP